MTKPVYRYPPFVIGIEAEITETKRYWLKLKIDDNKKDNVVVILKNPSRATKEVSDKTVFTVTNYIEKNSQRFKCLKNVGSITILNLMPVYETDSSKLRNMPNDLFDEKNTGTIEDVTSKTSTVIIAWGDHPRGLSFEYGKLKDSVLTILARNKNNVYYVDKLSTVGNPKHGQVWGYPDRLKKFKFPTKI
jgi:hypothetical protein